jgi:hypothetical protein
MSDKNVEAAGMGKEYGRNEGGKGPKGTKYRKIENME